MIPVSTLKLRPGDFCFVPRDDGRFVPFAYLCSMRQKRSCFQGGILEAVVNEPSVESLPRTLKVRDYALVHIKCFKENNTPIVGNVAERIGVEALQATERNAHDFSVGARSRVWGHLTILKYANQVEA
jgi:hypothetical protein